MKKTLLIGLMLLVLGFKGVSQEIERSELEQFLLSEFTYFQDTVNPTSYTVFIMDINTSNSSVDTAVVCISMSYIWNAYEMNYSNFDYFFDYNNQVSLVNIDDCNYLKQLNLLKSMNFEDSIRIRNILLPESSGGATGYTNGLISCKVGDKEIRKFYQYSSDMPSFNKLHHNTRSPSVIFELLKSGENPEQNRRQLRLLNEESGREVIDDLPEEEVE